MANALFSISIPIQTPISQRPCNFTSNPCLHAPTTASFRYPSRPFVSLCSSSSLTSIVEDDASPQPDALPVRSDSSAIEEADKFPLRGCKACGREELERGCNGEGRIQGGIATVPGFGWWPIKAYRPCPGFLASGGRYRRQGQSMDDL